MKSWSKWTVCSALCSADVGKRRGWDDELRCVSWDASCRKGGVNAGFAGLLWLKGTGKESWGLEGCLKDMAGVGKYKTTAMLALLCPRLIITSAVLRSYQAGDTCVLLADLGCWHFHLILHSSVSLILTRAEHRPLKAAGREQALSSLESWAQKVEVSVMLFLLTHTCCFSPWILLSSGHRSLFSYEFFCLFRWSHCRFCPLSSTWWEKWLIPMAS